jgi:hypothetical protein
MAQMRKAERIAIDRDGMANPDQAPACSTPNGRGRRTMAESPMATIRTALIESHMTMRCRNRFTTISEIITAMPMTFWTCQAPIPASTRMTPVPVASRSPASHSRTRVSAADSATPPP